MADTSADTTDTPPDEKKSFIQKLGAAIPVAMTAIATVLAGMSTGGLSQSMYWRSTAAQDQAKTNDQWSFAGFKRSRSFDAEVASAELEALSGYAQAEKSDPTKEPDLIKQVRDWMGSTAENPVPPPITDASIVAVVQAIHHRKSEAEVLALARDVNRDELEKVLNEATARSLATETQWDEERKKARAATDKARAALKAAVGPARADAVAALTAARAVQYDIDNRRYRAESTMNQWVGFLTEVRVKTSTATSDRHLRRSYSFFTAMLIAQVGSVIASLGMNRKVSSLSAIAVVAGLVAVGFGAYVFLTM
jgi:hypothetical protein